METVVFPRVDQQLKNAAGMSCSVWPGKTVTPLSVVKIPMAVPLTTAFKQNIERIRRERFRKSWAMRCSIN
ncbi:phage tail protein [Escherichia coli]